MPPDDALHLMVVDDDSRIRSLLSRYLQGEGYRVTSAPSAAAARSRMEGLHFDALIVDVMMPGESGIDFVKSLRKTSDVPVLMLTARAETADRITGLEVGVDDYLAKPFEPRELLLRLSAVLRRNAPPSAETLRPEQVRFGDFVFHLERRELKRGNEVVRLTDREREMLLQLSAVPGATVARADLAGGGDVGDRAVDVQVNRLRRKIERDPANPLYLQTARGQGYRLVTGP